MGDLRVVRNEITLCHSDVREEDLVEVGQRERSGGTAGACAAVARPRTGARAGLEPARRVVARPGRDARAGEALRAPRTGARRVISTSSPWSRCSTCDALPMSACAWQSRPSSVRLRPTSRRPRRCPIPALHMHRVFDEQPLGPGGGCTAPQPRAHQTHDPCSRSPCRMNFKSPRS